MSGNAKIGGPFTKTPNPAWLKVRSDMFDAVKAKRDEEQKVRQLIDI